MSLSFFCTDCNVSHLFLNFFSLFPLTVFIRHALSQGIRLDGRKPVEYRDIDIALSRGEVSATATVVLGKTLVVAVVSAEIVPPYPDRPSEGMIQFHADVSPLAEARGISQAELTRLLDRSIRESDAIDTESLCIIGGEKVWLISCDIRVLDFSGGNVIDASLLAAMGAFRAFRKPEVSVSQMSIPSSSSASSSSSSSSSSAAGNDSNTDVTMGLGAPRVLVLHSADQREPLPLALHHTPLAVTLGIFRGIKLQTTNDEDGANVEKSGSGSGSGSGVGLGSSVVLVADPSLEEGDSPLFFY